FHYFLLLPPPSWSTFFPYTTLFRSLVEIGLQSLIVLDAVGAHEFLDFLVGVPLLAVHFIAADVKKLVGEKFAHLFDESIEEFVGDRKSTRLNSSHVSISYAVFCLKK